MKKSGRCSKIRPATFSCRPGLASFSFYHDHRCLVPVRLDLLQLCVLRLAATLLFCVAVPRLWWPGHLKSWLRFTPLLVLFLCSFSFCSLYRNANSPLEFLLTLLIAGWKCPGSLGPGWLSEAAADWRILGPKLAGFPLFLS